MYELALKKKTRFKGPHPTVWVEHKLPQWTHKAKPPRSTQGLKLHWNFGQAAGCNSFHIRHLRNATLPVAKRPQGLRCMWKLFVVWEMWQGHDSFINCMSHCIHLKQVRIWNFVANLGVWCQSQRPTSSKPEVKLPILLTDFMRGILARSSGCSQRGFGQCSTKNVYV